MKKLFTALAVIGLSGLMNSAAIAHQNGHYVTLKDEFLKTSRKSISFEKIEGAYLGLCFDQTSEDPIRMILTTKKFPIVEDADLGPVFPPKITFKWKTWPIRLKNNGASNPANAYQIPTQSDLSNFWEEKSIRIAESKLNAGVISSGYADKGIENDELLLLKMNRKGIIYGALKKNTVNPGEWENYCYFYKKIYDGYDY